MYKRRRADSCPRAKILLDNSINNKTFTINAADFLAIQDFLGLLLTTERTNPPAEEIIRGMSWTKAPAFDASESLAESINISQTIENVAQSMTNNIRENGVRNFTNSSIVASNMIDGTGWNNETLVRVNYSKSALAQI